jgi:uncharacterized protein (DUF3820 family)
MMHAPVKTRELNLRQAAHVLNISYNDIYRTIRFYAITKIPVRKYRGRLLIPADALPWLEKLHYKRKNGRVPNGWVKFIELVRRRKLIYHRALGWAKKLDLICRFPFCKGYYIREDNEQIRLLVSLCRHGRPPKDEWVLLTEAVKDRQLRARIRSLIYLVEPIQIGKSIYIRRNDLEWLKELASGGDRRWHKSLVLS